MTVENENVVRKADRELAVFDEFAQIANLDVYHREKREQQGKPDIFARLYDGTDKAYELVELAEEPLRRKDGDHERNQELLRQAIESDGADHLQEKWITCRFQDYASRSRVRQRIPAIVQILNSLSPSFDGHVPHSTLAPVSDVVVELRVRDCGIRMVDCAILTSWTDSSPAQDAPPECSWDDLAPNFTERLRKKIEDKTYSTDCPIELVAWCGSWGLGCDDMNFMWLPNVRDWISNRQDLGPFQRLWIVNLAFERKVLASFESHCAV